MSSTLSEKIKTAEETVMLALVCAVIWFFEFIFYPKQALRDLRALRSGEYEPRYSASDHELDWIDEQWKDRKR